jgi:hypothetical protein
MNTFLLRLGAGVALLGCASGNALQSEAAPPDAQLSLVARSAVVHPLGAVSLRLTVTNRGDELRLDRTLLSSYSETQFLLVTDPDGKTSRHSCVQPRASTEIAEADLVRIPEEGTANFDLLVGFDFSLRTPLFERPGVYALAISIGGAASDPVQIECVEAPESESAAKAVLDRLRSERLLDALYNPYYLSWPTFGAAEADLSSIAWTPGSRSYAGLARVTLSRSALWRSRSSSLDVSRQRELLRQAREWAGAVTPSIGLDEVLVALESEIDERGKQLDPPK